MIIFRLTNVPPCMSRVHVSPPSSTSVIMMCQLKPLVVIENKGCPPKSVFSSLAEIYFQSKSKSAISFFIFAHHKRSFHVESTRATVVVSNDLAECRVSRLISTAQSQSCAWVLEISGIRFLCSANLDVHMRNPLNWHKKSHKK
jgi:hypothetical protein